jgi:Sulfatase-modifying factor enzyme 1
MKTTALFLGFLSAVFLGAAHAAITIQTVTIGDLGNPNDSTTGGLYGGVSSTYAIGTYEVTLLQYTAFLNAVGATDTNALYNPSMGTDLNIAGISRSGASGSFAYSVIGDGNRPVTYVSWFDAARFTNWLHNGQPTGLQTASTTENGAYALLGANSGVGLSKSLGGAVLGAERERVVQGGVLPARRRRWGRGWVLALSDGEQCHPEQSQREHHGCEQREFPTGRQHCQQLQWRVCGHQFAVLQQQPELPDAGGSVYAGGQLLRHVRSRWKCR